MFERDKIAEQVRNDKFIIPRKFLVFFALLAVIFLFTSCVTEITQPTRQDNYFNVYQIFVGSFYDSDGDGIGDLRGITMKLDYIGEILGADAIWLTPINPSPTYHKYDVTDYTAIDPDFGTLQDFKDLIEAANERGIAVIKDLVVNHTSTEHPWFQNALEEIQYQKDFHYFNYYNFTHIRQPSHYPAGGGFYYEAVFWSGMPDLNWDNADVRREFEEIVKFWLDLGVAGFRLDAAKHIYENDHAANIAFWTWFAEMCRAVDPNVYLVAEVWDTDSVMVPYYLSGLESLMNFTFAGANGIITNSINRQNGNDLAFNIERYDTIIRRHNENAINAVFISNHDMDRSAEYFGGDEEKMKLAVAIQLLIPGNSFIYYGEEIGMTGRGRDENKRAPMVWSLTDQTGQTNPPQNATYVPVMSEGVAEQLAREDSLLNYYRAILEIKNRHPAIARGIPTRLPTTPINRFIGAYMVTHGETSLIIVHNLSPQPQTAIFPDTGTAADVTFLEGISALSGADSTGFNWDYEILSIEMPGYGTAILSINANQE